MVEPKTEIKKCRSCRGTGWVSYTDARKHCRACGGQGTVVVVALVSQQLNFGII